MQGLQFSYLVRYLCKDFSTITLWDIYAMISVLLPVYAMYYFVIAHKTRIPLSHNIHL